MQTVILFPLNCITAIHNIMNTLESKYYEMFLNDKLIDDVLLKFFQARQSIVSWIIFSDGIGQLQIECGAELVAKLNVVEGIHLELMGEEVQLYQIFNDRSRVA